MISAPSATHTDPQATARREEVSRRDFFRGEIARRKEDDEPAQIAAMTARERDDYEYSLHVEEHGDAAYPTIEEWREAV